MPDPSPEGPPTATALRWPSSRSALTALIASIALVVAGCGAGSSSNGPGPSPATFTAAAFRYASCMRDHGLSSFPDPAMTDHNGQQVAYLDTPNSLVASPAFKIANKACQGILTPVLDTAQAVAARAAREQHMLAFAMCMRKHGVPGFPDPTSQDQLTQQMITSAGIELRTPGVSAAKTCLPSADGLISAQWVERALHGQ
jgi:hypothetical protein